MGWQIFVHSFRQVVGNLSGALRVSAALTIVQVAVTLSLGQTILLDPASLQKMMMTGTFPGGQAAIVLGVNVITWLWIAVGWHRYVLLEEQPAVVPMLRPGRMLGYLGQSLLITLVLMAVAVPLSMIVGVLAGAMAAGGALEGGVWLALGLFALLVYLPLAVIGLRLSTALPGVAMAPGVPLFQGWQATRNQTGPIISLVVILALFGFALQYVTGLALNGLPVMIAIVLDGAVQWFIGMVGISVLTTLYGHYIEGRALRL